MSLKDMELDEGAPFCNEEWKDNILRIHEKHICYLDQGHEGPCVCGYCDMNYDEYIKEQSNETV